MRLHFTTKILLTQSSKSVASVHSPIALFIILDVGLPKGWFTMLGISEMVKNSMSFLQGVVPFTRVSIVNSTVDSSAGKGRDCTNHSNDGKGWDDFPPHSI